MLLGDSYRSQDHEPDGLSLGHSYEMAHGKGKHGLDSRIACVSPLWKHSSGSSVVTLKMRPPATPLTSLDTFMAAHSPRRFCQTRQRYLLSK